ncbi:hypothetical protein DGo_CA2417 [Deinococcus gobiensis I-0]|uniref:Uncharacterized protein n=1 Tax=Deinococcus gobiensis (strain DSM 21396 / JCM 16679 / CGMCC 1.7299 / I-0) TaxID=745776 RepID=H8H032_DEIGI|nr:hypothetical protein DGo_CA2417 [Deinococcus gobiensis I-0]
MELLLAALATLTALLLASRQAAPRKYARVPVRHHSRR